LPHSTTYPPSRSTSSGTSRTSRRPRPPAPRQSEGSPATSCLSPPSVLALAAPQTGRPRMGPWRPAPRRRPRPVELGHPQERPSLALLAPHLAAVSSHPFQGGFLHSSWAARLARSATPETVARAAGPARRRSGAPGAAVGRDRSTVAAAATLASHLRWPPKTYPGKSPPSTAPTRSHPIHTGLDHAISESRCFTARSSTPARATGTSSV
jgi:hypothetical protein